MSISSPNESAQLSPTPRVAVVAPTFNNAGTVIAVLEGLARLGLAVIVVDDGSTDATSHLLAAWLSAGEDGQRHVVTHARNCGKAAAMRSGFERAAMIGFTHALTIDTDAQHDVADVPALLRASRAAPGAIVLGSRSTSGEGYPRRSRVGRTLSNGLVWLIGGVFVADSQCGLRVYPLDVVRCLGARTSRYAFETEVLARAGWANVEVVEVPVRCIYAVAGGRVTHFRPWRDTASAVLMHLRLLVRTLAPLPTPKRNPPDDSTESGTFFERCVRWMNPRRTWRRIRHDALERDRAAVAMGVGLFIGIQPLFGLKTVLCVAVARIFRLPPLVVLGASSLTSPPMGIAAWTASIVLGHLLMHGHLPLAEGIDFHARRPAEVMSAVAAEWIVGAAIGGAIVSVITWLASRAVMRRVILGDDTTMLPSAALIAAPVRERA